MAYGLSNGHVTDDVAWPWKATTSWRQSRRVSTSLNNLPTTKSSCVVSAVWTHQSSVVTQFLIFCASHI